LCAASSSATGSDACTTEAPRHVAADDPTGFVGPDSMMVIDEIQLAPELLTAIKVTVDLDPRPGQFLLTGSSRILAMRTLPYALPGRMEVIDLWPFSASLLIVLQINAHVSGTGPTPGRSRAIRGLRPPLSRLPVGPVRRCRAVY
jgi:hypothetical protein